MFGPNDWRTDESVRGNLTCGGWCSVLMIPAAPPCRISSTQSRKYRTFITTNGTSISPYPLALTVPWQMLMATVPLASLDTDSANLAPCGFTTARLMRISAGDTFLP